MNRYWKPSEANSESPPSEAWLFAQLILGKPIPRIVRPEAKARAKREELEWRAQFSSRHAEELRKLEAAEVETRHDREVLEWAAQISTRAEEKLRALLCKEAQEREAWRRAEQFYETHCLSLTEWDPDQPRQPKGTPEGGQWAPKGEGGGAGGAQSPPSAATPFRTADYRADQSTARIVTVSDKEPQHGGTSSPSHSPSTKSQLPADHRGTWISGTKGHGVFRYNDSIENQQAGLAGKEVRFENQHIAIGGFPPETYYGGSAASASVEIESVAGTNADSLAADAAMRKKLGDPTWQRPDGFRWNHAGAPGSKSMELVENRVHRGVAHKGPGAVPRAQTRAANSRGATGRAMGALTVYLVARDVLQTGGILKPDYEVAERETYRFRAEDGSVFIVRPGGLFSNAERRFVDGPRKGQTEKISNAEVEQFRKRAEEEFGKYIPGSRISEPRFIPGRQRSSLPLIIHKYGIPHEAGRIDEKGVHHSFPRPLPI